MADSTAHGEIDTPRMESTPPASRKVVVTIALLIVLGPVLYSFVRSEVARWYSAAAYERWLEDDLMGALERLDKAIEWKPRQLNLLTQRARWRLQTGDAASALPDCDLALALARAEYGSQKTPISKRRLGIALNQNAYAHALAESDLATALENIELAIGIVGNDYNLLDTRGYIHLKRGDLELAQPDLESALEAAEADYKSQMQGLRQQRRDSVDKRPVERAEGTLREALAVLTHHRGELYEALGREEEATSDLRRAKRLGYDPARGIW